MFRAIGFVITLVVISNILSGAFSAFENATIAVFETVETAALVSQTQLEQRSQ